MSKYKYCNSIHTIKLISYPFYFCRILHEEDRKRLKGKNWHEKIKNVDISLPFKSNQKTVDIVVNGKCTGYSKDLNEAILSFGSEKHYVCEKEFYFARNLYNSDPMRAPSVDMSIINIKDTSAIKNWAFADIAQVIEDYNNKKTKPKMFKLNCSENQYNNGFAAQICNAIKVKVNMDKYFYGVLLNLISEYFENKNNRLGKGYNKTKIKNSWISFFHNMCKLRNFYTVWLLFILTVIPVYFGIIIRILLFLLLLILFIIIIFYYI